MTERRGAAGRTTGGAVAARVTSGLVAAAVVLVGCTAEPGPAIEVGTVRGGEVVETVAAPARIEPRDRVTVTAPASGTVAELLVADGDEVAAGDPLARLASPSVESSVEQAAAAVAAADALAGVPAGVDLSPLVAAVREQYEAVLPDLLTALAEQAAGLPEEQRQPALDAVAEAMTSYNEAVANLRAAERDAAAAAGLANASQRAAAEAQRQQAELALAAAERRADDLTITAPTSGVVELARGGDAAAPDLGGLDPEADLGAFEGLVGGGGETMSAGPIAVGVDVVASQPLLKIFDVAEFRAVADVDEIDVVAVGEGQEATVLVDAYPTSDLSGVVEHVALEPAAGPGGGVLYPVTIRLTAVPTGVALRTGLTGAVEVVTRVVDAELVVPSSALRRRGEVDVVYVVRGDVIREVDVRVVAIGEEDAAVEGDLASGEAVVVSGIDEVQDGDPAPAQDGSR